MNVFVKKFIEDSKYIISKDMWEVFFYKWYRAAAMIWPAQDEEEELFNILKQAGIPVDWEAREQIITEATKEHIDRVLDNLDQWYGNSIAVDYLENELTTFLGYDVYQIDNLINKAANDLGLTLNQDKTAYLIS